MAELRVGCPWDKTQTHESLRAYLLEETYEVLEALDKVRDGVPNAQELLREELGDLLFQILFHSRLAEEEGHFAFPDVENTLVEKLIRRHPHVFGDKKHLSREEISQQWEHTKNQEKKKDSLLADIPPALPALLRSKKVIEKVSKVGFQWPDLKGPLAKLEEEIQELKKEISALEALPASATPVALQQRLEAELGDVFFAVANIAHFLKIDPENSLRVMLTRFEKRFRHIETRAKEMQKSLSELSLDEMDVFWNEAKKLEKPTEI